MPDPGAAIDTYVETNLEAYLDETAQLCRIPSVSAHGEHMTEAADVVAALLTAHGFAVEQFATPGNPIVVGRAPGDSPRTLLCYNHYDVQPAEPLELWTSPPFAPVVRDGNFYARGAKDDKGEFVARLAAVEAARAANGGRLPCGITFVVEGQEEVGSPHVAAFVRQHTDLLASQGAIWEEGGVNAAGRPVEVLGKRGILYVEIGAATLARDAHSGSASVLPNAAWRLLWALDSLRGRDGRIRIPGFYDAAKPPSPVDLDLLRALSDDEEAELRAEFGVDHFVNDATGLAFKAARFEPTCNIAGIMGGYEGPGMKTVIPARATAKVDFRLVPDQDPDDIFRKLRLYLDEQGFADLTLARLGAMWPATMAPDDPLVQLESRTAIPVYGAPPELVPLSGGSSPVYAFAGPLHIPVISPGLGYPGSRTHAPDEHFRLVDFVNAARHIGRIIAGFGDLPDGAGD